MAGDIIIRKAEKDYVCDVCGHIIKKGTQYLDKVILHDTKCVRHDRYHDECPLNKEQALFNKISVAEYGLFCSFSGEKHTAVGIAEGNVLVRAWQDTAIKPVPIDEFFKCWEVIE